MNLGLKITWSSPHPPLAYLRLMAALRFHNIPLVLPVFPPAQGSAKAARRAFLN